VFKLLVTDLLINEVYKMGARQVGLAHTVKTFFQGISCLLKAPASIYLSGTDVYHMDMLQALCPVHQVLIILE
jgi:hypothetical protein